MHQTVLDRTTEIPFKRWRYEEGDRLGLKAQSIFMRVQRGHYPYLRLRRVNKRVVFVVVAGDCG